MKKKILLLFLVVVLAFYPSKVNAKADLASSAASAILIEASTGEVIYEKNANERRSPASMTKLMSMLLFIEHIEKGGMKWSDIITTSEYASSMGGSQIYLETGEQMSVLDLLKGVSIASANDVVVSIKQSHLIKEEWSVKHESSL